MASKTDIANGVFTLLGVSPVLNVEDDPGDESVVFRAQYDIARRKVLRETNWRFAIKTAKLLKVDGATPGIDYAAAYQMPTNPKSLMVVNTSLLYNDAWSVYGDQLHANEQPTIEYVADVGVDVFDASAENCLMLLLASRLSIPIKSSKTERDTHYRQYMEEMREARQSNGYERGRPDRHRQSLKSARFDSGYTYDRGR